MKIILSFLLFVGIVSTQAQKREQITSPDGRLQLTVEIGNIITWSVKTGDQTIIAPSPLSVTLGNGEIWGQNARIQKTSKQTADNIITRPFYKKIKLPTFTIS